MKDKDADKGQPAITKQTLDDVLRALQDLVRNELATNDTRRAPARERKPPAEAKIKQPAAPDTGIQNELPLADEAPSLKPAPRAQETQAPGVTDAREDLPVLTQTVSGLAPLDDLPVLNEVVPSARTPRGIAVQVAARLNIELRRSGQSPLPPAIIDRLE